MKYLTILVVSLLSLTAYAGGGIEAEECKPKVVEVCPKGLICMTKAALNDIISQVNMQGFEEGEKRIVYVQKKDNTLITRVVESRTNYEYKSLSPKLNRFSLLAGVAPENGFRVTQTIPTVQVELLRGPTFGAQYQRLITDDISLGVLGLSNGSGLISVGLDF